MSDTTVIAEETWNCFGNPNIPKQIIYTPSLLNDVGLQCCLGFECEQCGTSRGNLLSVIMPMGIIEKDMIGHLLDGRGNNGFSASAQKINDSFIISYEDKKRKLKALWAEYGWTLVFVKTVRGMKRKLAQLKGG